MIVIIGITVGFALIAFGDFGASKRILFAAEQFENTLRLAQQRAILTNRTLGLYVDNRSYRIVTFGESNQWQKNTKSALFQTHSFPDTMIIQLKKSHQVTIKTPEIMIDSSGEISPFTLIFSSTHEHNIATLQCSEHGELTLTTHLK